MADTGPGQPQARGERLAELNLEQALIDLEIANARVIDLTGRVTSISSDLLQLRAEVGSLQLALSQEHAEVERLRVENGALTALARRSLVSRLAHRLRRARTGLTTP